MSLTNDIICNSVDETGSTAVAPSKELNNNGEKKVPEGFVNVAEQDSSAYMANYRAHKTGISHDEMVKAYSDWADNYDVDLCPGRYNGPSIAAESLAGYYAPERRATVKLLDVAAGTGRVGHELNLKGFKNIDALEPSSGMLRVLKGRNVYTDTFETPIGFDVIDAISANTYDSLVIAGGMGEGHIPVQAIAEMIRVVKPGGTVVIVMREEYLTYVTEYVDKLEPYMQSLQDKGFWKQVSRVIVPEYSFNKNGVVYTYEVTSDDYPRHA
jgi:SAM-dependent methyltransferase